MSAAAFLAVALALLYRTALSNPGNATGNDHAIADRAAALCGQLQDHLGPSRIVLPSNPEYTELREDNWSQTAWRRPSCIASLNATAEIASLVSVLADNQIAFAIRYRGHSPNPHDSNIDTGVLIALANFDEVSSDAGTGLVSMGPGARWEAVYGELDKYNRSMVGGRVMDVGVGGLTLGSGLSYLSDLYVLACDNVVSYEDLL
ncbi:Uu.00g031480.m01.CDS01 [Anthostomella pinea]|uniref:Uu.00g031480.m01.CDS01 n=1 Tax=Anthostomella pinea TaxID=933095 RepID=A0AAI8YD20_9PEZI|nr:Uu.00g031480.m01.CDS01 [Anthostomella pinea]